MKTDFKNVKKAVVSLSGGLDSTTLLHLAVKELGAENVYALSFNYNQRHSVELQCATTTCKKLGVYHKIINLGFLGEITAGVSAMVQGIVPTPHMDDLEAGKVVPTYVPFRNSILSTITFAFAETVGADAIALGVQYGDYENSENYFYWDCSAAFTETMQQLANLNDKHSIQYIAPFVSLKKTDEIKLGVELGIDYSDAWTCYNPAFGETRQIAGDADPMGGRNL
jgi:7-cyano-7-deazaguanine synthase